jgi:proteasome activator-like protein
MGSLPQDEEPNVTEPPRPQIVVPGQAQTEEDQTVVAQPAKLLRIASMIRELVEEVRGSQVDDAGRKRLADIYQRSVDQLKDSLSPELQKELESFAGPLQDPPSESEVRVAQAQLLGWLEGLFHGIQAALWAQHMQAQAALQEMRRRQLPSGPPSAQPPGEPGTPGQYL